MRPVDCVGALIQDEQHRVYVHRRTAERRLYPGIWDIVGGHLEDGETPEEALAREVEEETGWRVREIVAAVTDWEWEYEGRIRRELDYLVTIDGDLRQPRLEEGKHDANAWVGPDDLELLMLNRTDGDRRLRDIVAHTVRTRFTERLRLEPVTGPGEVLTGHAADLERLMCDPWVSEWYAETWSTEQSVLRAAAMQAAWEREGVSKWMAYELTGGVQAEHDQLNGRREHEALVGRGERNRTNGRGERGALVGRGGLSRLPADGPATASITEVLKAAGPGGESLGEVWAADRLELGWALVGEARRRGFATEIGRAGLEFAFGTLGAGAVIAFTERHNRASRAVMERLGMEFAGEIRTEGLVEGQPGVHPDAPFAVYAIRA
jgi:RimJ/RimL family protein N-acetyltransferase/8-oxo-dGTP pyrophosphatase MutT (NUDIX family)